MPVHIPDGFLDGKTCVGAFCLAAAGLSWATRQIRIRWSDQTVPLIGVMSAFLFAGQMVNFPVASGTSGHLLGSVLAATFLGPYAAAVALTTVLVIQCFLFQDGGVTALGADVLNMALIASFSGYVVYRTLRRWFGDSRGIVFSASVASWVSVVLAAAACALELAAAGTISLGTVFPAMVLTHAVIGIGEAVITGAVVSFILKVRPDLVYEPTRGVPVARSFKPLIGCGLLLAVGIALLVKPLASSLPDGLESLAARFGFLRHVSQRLHAPLAGYELPGFASNWLVTSLVAVLGIVLTFGLARAVARWLRRSRPHVDGR
jgi:cobalt/nickel transport system permease protein